MNKLTSTARKLDIFFRILKVMVSIGMVTCCVGLVLIGAYFLFDLAPEMIGSGYNTVEIGSLELALADPSLLQTMWEAYLKYEDYRCDTWRELEELLELVASKRALRAA